MPNPNNLFLFHGPDQEALEKEIQIWTKNFEQKFGTTNLSILKNKTNLADIKNQVNTQAFLAEKRLILAYDLYSNSKKEEQDDILDFIENFNSDNILVLIETKTIRKNSKLLKLIDKHGTRKEFTLSLNSLKNKALDQLKKHNKSINPFDLEKLIKNLEEDPFKVHQEVEKLALSTQNNVITAQDILNVSSQTEQVSAFKLMDAISGKNLKQSLDLFHKLLANNEDLIKLLFLVIRQIRLLIQVKDLSDRKTAKSDIAKKLKLAPFAVSNFLKFSSNFSYSKLAQALEKLLQLDSGLKDGTYKHTNNQDSDLILALEQFIIWLCEK